MPPTEINHAVAEVLYEALNIVRRRGCGWVEPHINDTDFDQQDPSVIDWDASGDNRVISLYEVAI